MARFNSIPSIPISDVDVWEAKFLNAIKQNIELLVGSRNEPDSASKAVLSLRTSFPYPDKLQFTNFSTVTQHPNTLTVVLTNAGGTAVSPTTYAVVQKYTFGTTTNTYFDVGIPTDTNLLAYAQDVTALSSEIDSINSTLDNLIVNLRGGK